MRLRKQIVAAREGIATRFLRQCRDGPQSAGLAVDVKACGQRLDETESPQRGLHGTAAAIRVLAQHEHHEARALIPQLVRYVAERARVERPEVPESIRGDACNVIKISEALFALHHVDGAVAPTEDLRKELSERLLRASIAGRGWSYYTDLPQQVELLPTAFAVQALATEGYPVEGQVQSLVAAVSGRVTGEGRVGAADVSVKVLCLYVLAFGKAGQALVREVELKKPFMQLWAKLSSLLKNEDIEQNVEYDRRDEHRYVRVPWQLHLMALAARLAPFRSFAAYSVQSRLRSILTAATSPAGFLYPHSGAKVSARTNATLYGVLKVIQGRLPEVGWMLVPGVVVDFLVNSRLTALVARAVAVVVGLVSVLSWVESGRSELAALAPNILSAVLLFLLSARRDR